MNRAPIHSHHDLDPQETNEWLESLQAVIEQQGPVRAHFLIEKLVDLIKCLNLLPYHVLNFHFETFYEKMEW